MKDSYQKATLALIAAGDPPDVVIGGLKSTLTSRGHEALLPSILRGVLRQLEAKKQVGAKVTIAKEADHEKFEAAIKQALLALNLTDQPTYQIDDTIIGGFVVEGNDQVVNQSYKHRLVQLYRTLTR